MKIVRTNHRHKLHYAYGIILEYNRGVNDVTEYNSVRRALNRTLGEKFSDFNAGIRNPRWFWEENLRYNRRRIYLLGDKELTWVQMSK